MNCIVTEGKTVKAQLLTHADSVRKVEELLARYRHATDLFLPDESFYGTEVSVDDPERMADTLFRWLGIKHRSVTFHIDPNQKELIQYAHRKNGSQISLGYQILTDPLLCAGAVAHSITHHLLLARAKISVKTLEENEAFTDLGTIHAGFGILILNAFETESAPLGALGRQNYASEFLDYCLDQRIVSSLWQPYVFPHIAEAYLSTQSSSKKLKPFISQRLLRKRYTKERNFALIGSAFVLVLAGTLYTLTQPKELSSEMQQKLESMNVLKGQIEHCRQTVQYKNERWDTSDIFIQRQIDADKTRCTSLLNRYNYEVGQYNNNLR